MWICFISYFGHSFTAAVGGDGVLLLIAHLSLLFIQQMAIFPLSFSQERGEAVCLWCESYKLHWWVVGWMAFASLLKKEKKPRWEQSRDAGDAVFLRLLPFRWNWKLCDSEWTVAERHLSLCNSTWNMILNYQENDTFFFSLKKKGCRRPIGLYTSSFGWME